MKKRKPGKRVVRKKPAPGKLRGGLDPSIGRRTQFQPGRSPNPGGKPSTQPITELYRAQLEQLVDKDPLKRTYGQMLAEGQVRAAIRGDTGAAREITDRVQGRSVQPVELTGSEGSPLNFKLNIRFRDVTKKPA